MSFTIIIIILLIEVFLSSTWNPFYFKKGLMLYKKTYNAGDRKIILPESSTLTKKYSSSWKPSFVFEKLSEREMAFREKILQLSFTSYTPILHAYLVYDSESKTITLKCFVNYTITAFIVSLIYSLFFDSEMIHFNSLTIVVDVVILVIIIGLMAACFGGIAAYQIQQFKLVPETIINKYNKANSADAKSRAAD